MIRLWNWKKRISDLCIFLVCNIIINILFIDDLFNIRWVGQVIQKTGVYFDLAVNPFPGLLQHRIHILHCISPAHTADPHMTVPCQDHHRNQTGYYQKDRQLMTIFHIFKFSYQPCLKSLHPLRFLSCKIPDCFHNIHGSFCKNKIHW